MSFFCDITFGFAAVKNRGRKDMEAPDGKLKNILKDATFNVMMDISVVNGIIYNKDENVIDNEAYIFEGVIKSWKEAAIRKYYIWVEETYGGRFLLRTDKNIV